MKKTIVILYSDTLSSYLLYSRFIRRHPELIACLVRFPVVPRRQRTQASKEPMILRILKRSSREFLFFNFCIVVIYRIFAKFFQTRLADLARAHGIPEHLFGTIDEECLSVIANYHPAWIFNNSPNLLKENILTIPTFGTLNYHAAPLPEFRGAGNYFWLLAEGQSTARATLHYVTVGLDAGDIIMYSPEFTVSEGMSIYELWYRLRDGADECFERFVSYYADPRPIPAQRQDESRAGTRSFPGKDASRSIRTKGHRVMKWNEFCSIVRIAISGNIPPSA